MKQALGIKLGIFAALALVAIYTIGNRRWWWHRINAKWNYSETFTDEFGDGVRTVNVPENPSIPMLAAAYFNGREGWTKIPSKA